MAKNVVVFFDGTRNRLRHAGGTNVHALYEMTCAAGGTQQCLYLSGVGTERVKTAVIDALRNRAMLGKDYHRVNTGMAGRLFGAMAGYGIAGRIKEAYSFIVDHFDQAAGDQLFLFGFSRGAFAARSLAGFVNEVGLLFRHHLSKVPEAYELYRSGEDRLYLEKHYSYILGRQIRLGDGLPVYMIGVWDTVGALGLPPPFQKLAWRTDHHITHKMPPNVTHGRHALALHELRSIFAPVPWERDNEKQSLIQMWFAGAHADVGGGYEDAALSVTPLMWMAFEAEKLGLGLSHSVLQVAEPMRDVHHEISGVFSLCIPRCRPLLISLSKPSDGVALDSYAVHWSAIQRQDRRMKARIAYPYWFPIRMSLAKIDTITRAVVVRLAEYGNHDYAVDNSTLYGDQRAKLIRALEHDDEWTAGRINELKEAIVLVSLAHGWNESAVFLVNTVDQLASRAHAVGVSDKIAAGQRLDAALKALEKVGKAFESARFQSLIERVTLYVELNYRAPVKTVKLKKLKL